MSWFVPLRRMIVKEYTQSFRDPKMSRLILVAPLIQILLFGYVISLDVKHVPVAIYDLDNSRQSRELMERFVRSKYFDVVEYIHDDDRALWLINHAEVQAVFRLNHGFAEALKGKRAAPFQILLDGSDSNSASVVVNYASEIVSRYNGEIQMEQVKQEMGQVPESAGVELHPRALFNENLESRNFFAPGMVALILLQTTMTMGSMAIVREKEIGTMEQILVTPITKLQFILGKMIPFASIGIFDAAVVTLIAIFWFDVPFRGNIILLFCATLLYLMCTLGVGLLVSTISQTQQQAIMGAIFFNNPFMLLSGFTFPIANMPKVIQWFTFVNPLRYFLIVLRSIFLKGSGFGVLWPQFLCLAILGTAILGIAAWRFQKTAA